MEKNRRKTHFEGIIKSRGTNQNLNIIPEDFLPKRKTAPAVCHKKESLDPAGIMDYSLPKIYSSSGKKPENDSRSSSSSSPEKDTSPRSPIFYFSTPERRVSTPEIPPSLFKKALEGVKSKAKRIKSLFFNGN